ncbi:uncharacterized protein LOC129547359 [Moschus berezovskii]|uniref:uncharacterized protein LOC129547359 n=1 Tax=Moschus berezovskii TaxID=68408 RepID=UPI0024442E00|nr:uncharacterized protein LOC129547359 [Moschus berezovskii]
MFLHKTLGVPGARRGSGLWWLEAARAGTDPTLPPPSASLGGRGLALPPSVTDDPSRRMSTLNGWRCHRHLGTDAVAPLSPGRAEPRGEALTRRGPVSLDISTKIGCDVEYASECDQEHFEATQNLSANSLTLEPCFLPRSNSALSRFSSQEEESMGPERTSEARHAILSSVLRPPDNRETEAQNKNPITSNLTFGLDWSGWPPPTSPYSKNYISQAPLLSDSWASSVSGRQRCSQAGEKLEYFFLSLSAPTLWECPSFRGPCSHQPSPVVPGFHGTVPSSSLGNAAGFLLLLIQGNPNQKSPGEPQGLPQAVKVFHCVQDKCVSPSCTAPPPPEQHAQNRPLHVQLCSAVPAPALGSHPGTSRLLPRDSRQMEKLGLREDKGCIQTPEAPAVSHQDSARPCTHVHLLCPHGVLPQGFMGHSPGSVTVTAGKGLRVTLPFLISSRGLTRSASQPFLQSPRPTLSTGPAAWRMTTARRSLWSQGEDAASVTRLEPSLLSSARITGWPGPRNLPTQRNQTHCCAAHAQDPEGLWE